MTTVAEKFAPQLARPLYDYTIPDADREFETDPHSFTIQPLTTLQEADASIEAGGDFGFKGLWVRAVRSIVQIDGKPVDPALSPTDNWGPRCRDYLVAAYGDVHNVSKENRADFFKSRVRRMP